MVKGNRSNQDVVNGETDDAEMQAEEGSGSRSVDKDTAEMRCKLAEQLTSLRFVNAALIVCVHALKQQAAEMDEEIALVLQRAVGDKLDETIDRIESITLGLEYDEV